MEESRDFTALLARKCKRKEARKTKKKLGIICRVAFTKHKKVENVLQEQMSSSVDRKKEKRQRKRQARANRKLKKEDEDDITIFRKEAEKIRCQNMIEDSGKDREEIAMLENKLGLRKKQKQKLAKNSESGEQGEEGLKKTAENYVDDLLSALDEDNGDTSSSEIDDSEMADESDEAGDENAPTGSHSGEEEMHDEDEIEENNAEEPEFSSALNSDEEESFDGEADEPEDDLEKGEDETPLKSVDFDEKILALAKRAKMNTPTKTKIFCTIMSSANSSDSYEKLKNLSLDGPEEREIVYVCIQCALLEAEYNPYYSVLISKFCELRKQFRLTTQFALWDSMKLLSTLKKHKLVNFVCLFADLLKLNSVGLAVFKVVEFGDETSKELEFVGRVIHRLLTKAPDAIQRQTFMRLINSNKHQRLTDGLENFLSQWKVEEFRASDNFSTFERQLGMVKRLFAVR